MTISTPQKTNPEAEARSTPIIDGYEGWLQSNANTPIIKGVNPLFYTEQSHTPQQITLIFRQPPPSLLITMWKNYPLTMTISSLLLVAGIVALWAATFTPQSLPKWLILGLYDRVHSTQITGAGAMAGGFGLLLATSFFSTNTKCTLNDIISTPAMNLN